MLSSFPLVGTVIQNYIERKGPGALSSGIARTKYIDDLLEKAIQSGVKQVIILGAGYDTRSLRLPFMNEVSVIEIDHPDTSKYKVTTLKSAVVLPATVGYHQIDFNVQNLEDLLHMTKLDFDAPVAIIWEGVTNYLTSVAVDKTFAIVSRLAAGTYIIFTYIDRLVMEKPGAYAGAETVMRHLKDLQEEWTFGFKPEELPRYLAEFGLILLEDNGANWYRQKYMPDRSTLSEGYGFYRVAVARRQ